MGTDYTQQRILIVGYGSVGRRHARNLLELGCRNLLFLRSGRTDVIQDAPPPGPVVATVREALAYAPLAAVIATPSALHLEAALPLAEAGCHLFLEKPLAADRDLEACERLCTIARSKKLVTMIGYPFRFHPLLLQLREGLRNQRLGEVFAARAEWGEYLPDWHPWEDHRQSYAARVDLGGGVLLTLIHPIDYFLWLFGEVAEVRGLCRKIPMLRTSVPDDWAELTLQFRNGVIGQVHLDYLQKPPVHQLSVWGSAGRADLDFHGGTLNWSLLPEGAEPVRTPPEFARNDMFVAELRHFLAAVGANRPTDVPLEEGIKGLRVVAQARTDASAHRDYDFHESRPEYTR